MQTRFAGLAAALAQILRARFQETAIPLGDELVLEGHTISGLRAVTIRLSAPFPFVARVQMPVVESALALIRRYDDVMRVTESFERVDALHNDAGDYLESYAMSLGTLAETIPVLRDAALAVINFACGFRAASITNVTRRCVRCEDAITGPGPYCARCAVNAVALVTSRSERQAAQAREAATS